MNLDTILNLLPFEVPAEIVRVLNNISAVQWMLLAFLIFQFYQKMQPFPYEDEDESSNGPKAIKTLQQWKEIQNDKANKDKIIIIDFYATWCPPCKSAAPKYHALALNKKYEDCVFYKCNVDIGKEVAGACCIESMPTFKLFKNMQEIGVVQGYNESSIIAIIEENSK